MRLLSLGGVGRSVLSSLGLSRLGLGDGLGGVTSLSSEGVSTREVVSLLGNNGDEATDGETLSTVTNLKRGELRKAGTGKTKESIRQRLPGGMKGRIHKMASR